MLAGGLSKLARHCLKSTRNDRRGTGGTGSAKESSTSARTLNSRILVGRERSDALDVSHTVRKRFFASRSVQWRRAQRRQREEEDEKGKEREEAAVETS